ncbi:MAG: type IVB secretion system protein IcmH/DotU [Pseudomonadota bacterium]
MADNDDGGFGPGRDPNVTMIIPNPGGRMRKEPDAPQPDLRPTANRSGPSAPPAESSARVPHGLQVAVQGQSNRFLAAANKLITVLNVLGNTLSHPNIPQLQQELASEIGNFDHALKQADVRSEEALTARYIVCCAIDEAILDTPWGAESGWAGRSLLMVYHNEAHGGERFFDLLEQVCARPRDYRELIELFYVLLSMGFRGRYALEPTGESQLETLRERVYQDIYSDTRSERQLSPRDPSSQTVSAPLRSQIPLWAIFSIVLALTLVVYVGLRAWMYSGTRGAVERMDAIYPVRVETLNE